MSVESTALERSALERKDREELTTIAQALGAKPTSRARKADLVQMILEITGVESPASADGTGTGTDAETGAGADGAAAASDDAAAPEAPVAADAPSEPPAEWEEVFADGSAGEPADSGGRTERREPAQRGGEGRQPSEKRQSDQPTSGGQAQAETKQQTDQKQGDQKPAATNQQTDQKQGDQKQPAQKQGEQQPGQQADGSEPGNRRRRRRGRRNKQDDGQTEEFTGEPVEVEGLLDLREEGYGFLRVRGSLPSKDDIYVSVKQVRQFGLRKGDHVAGASRPAMRNEKNPALLRIDRVNDAEPDLARTRRRFEDLTPLFPDEKLRLETAEDPANMTSRIVDLISPIGKGQRGLIVSPPKAGKTTIMKQIARSIEANNPEVKLIVLLVDERPEEVTDMRRWLRSPSSEVVASTFDRPADEHAHVAELTIERSKRMVEDGKDVCIILDGITRLARAYNLAAPPTGRIMSGGVDSGALYPPKKFFGAARNVEEGGSLTILATALIETGSKMDEVIFEEFKGTGNMELRLDRRMAERRVYPAIDVDASSTRHEELLFPRQQLQLVWALRRVLSGLSSGERGNAAALELLIDRMKTFRTNDEFLAEVAKAGG
jgi:transcription termination factor Rho